MSKFRYAAFADEAAESLDEQIKALKENDCSLIEIRGVNGKNIMDTPLNEIKEIGLKLKDTSISVWSLGSPIGKININDDFNNHIESFKKALEICDILGAENMRIFSFYVDENFESVREKVLERLNTFVELSQNSGVTLCHENEKGIYGDIATRCLDIHKNIPQIKAVFDPANFVQCNQESVSAFEMLLPYIKYMHIKDANKDGIVKAAGMGDGKILELLKKYKGEVLTLEPHLWEFSGLKNLEKDDNSSVVENAFNSQRGAFDYAFNSLKSLVKEV